MPRIKIELETQAGKTPVLTLSSVPDALSKSIRKGILAIKTKTPGLPTLRGKSDLTIRFPKTGLPDWIRYRFTAAGKLTPEGTTVNRQPAGRNALTAPATVFKRGSIVLLLESPHEQEMIAGQPASGPTGRNIASHLQDLERLLAPLVKQLYPSPAWDSTPFVVVNPCPYPTSCLATVGAWSRFRDLVFEHLFPLVQADFQSRLARYKPCIIINACTNGTQNQGGNIIFPDPNGGCMILQGQETASPKAMVGEEIKRYVDKRNFWRSAVRRTKFVLKTPVPAGQAPVGFWLELAHPASWRG